MSRKNCIDLGADADRSGYVEGRERKIVFISPGVFKRARKFVTMEFF